MNASQKYLVAGALSLGVALCAFVAGVIFVFNTPHQTVSVKPSVETTKATPILTTSPFPTSTKKGFTRHTVEKYNVSFEYPESWQLSPDLIFSDQDIEVSFARNFYKQDSGDFTAGLLAYLNSICSADGPTGSIQCLANDAKIQSYTNPQGTKGFQIFRIKTNVQILPVKSELLTPETVYAYPLKDSDAFAIVFSPTLTAKSQPKDLKSVADTLRFD